MLLCSERFFVIHFQDMSSFCGAIRSSELFHLTIYLIVSNDFDTAFEKTSLQPVHENGRMSRILELTNRGVSKFSASFHRVFVLP